MPLGQEVVCHGCQSGDLAGSAAYRFDRQHPCGNVMGRPSAPSHNSSCHIISYPASLAVTSTEPARTSAVRLATTAQGRRQQEEEESGSSAEGADRSTWCHRGGTRVRIKQQQQQQSPRFLLAYSSRNGVSCGQSAHMAVHRRASDHHLAQVLPVDMPSHHHSLNYKEVRRQQHDDDYGSSSSHAAKLNGMQLSSRRHPRPSFDASDRTCSRRLPWFSSSSTSSSPRHLLLLNMCDFTTSLGFVLSRASWLAIWISLLLALYPSVARAAPADVLDDVPPRETIDGVVSTLLYSPSIVA